MPRPTLRLLLLAAFAASACLSKAPPLELRYFEPRRTAVDLADGPVAPVRLKSATAAPHLRETMVWRLSEVELSFDERSRWAADPRAFLEREVRHALFERGTFYPGDDLGDLALDLHLEAFEGAVGATPSARVAVQATVRDASGPPRVRRFEATETLEGTTPESLARGTGRALARCISDLQGWLAGRAGAQPLR